MRHSTERAAAQVLSLGQGTLEISVSEESGVHIIPDDSVRRRLVFEDIRGETQDVFMIGQTHRHGDRRTHGWVSPRKEG
ncbi:MAG: hypothetical protein D6690_11035 [Nitrospirae bacterium]|nr:MAG: hypothetical protein D6690_11035 [Nitrospirota bacterium]